MKTIIVLTTLIICNFALAQVDQYQIRNLNYRVHAEKTQDQLRYIYYKAKVVDTIRHMREYNNLMHRTYRGRINDYSDLSLISASVTGTLQVINSDAFGYDNNKLIKGVIALLPIPKGSLLTRFVNFDSPGAGPDKVLEWLRVNNLEETLNNSKIDKEFAKIFNECSSCESDINRHFQNKFSFKINEDHHKYSSAVKQARDIEQTQNEVGNLSKEINSEMAKVKNILNDVAENQKRSQELLEYLKLVVEKSEDLSEKEKVDYSKKIDQGQIVQAFTLLKDKKILLKEERKKELVRLQREYNENMTRIQESRVYSNILTTVIGYQDPESARRIQGIISVGLNLAEMTMKFNNPTQSGVQISTALLTGNYIMGAMQLFSMFSSQGESNEELMYKNIMKALADISKQIQNLGEQISYRFDSVDERLRFIQTEMILLFKKTHENQDIIIAQNTSIMKKLNSMYSYSENQFRIITDNFKYVLSESFIDCKYDVDYGVITSWSKYRTQECLREFLQYSINLSQDNIFNNSEYLNGNNSVISTVTSEKIASLDHINYLIDYSKLKLSSLELVQKVPNPIMFNMGLSYFGQAYNSLLLKFKDSITKSEFEGLKKMKNVYKSFINEYQNLESELIKDNYKLLSRSLDNMSTKVKEFKKDLKNLEKEFIKFKLNSNNVHYDFLSGDVHNIDIDFDTDSLTMNKCDSVYTKSTSIIDKTELDKMNNISIVLDKSYHFIKNIPDHVKTASKLGLGKIKFCYDIPSVRPYTLKAIYDYYKKYHYGKRYSSSSKKTLHQDLMSGHLWLRIKGYLVPSNSRIRDLRVRLFKDSKLKAMLLKRLNMLKQLYVGDKLTVQNIISAPILFYEQTKELNRRSGLLEVLENPYFYIHCTTVNNKCEFNEKNNEVKITYNYNANESDVNAPKKIVKILKGKYKIKFSPKRNFLTEIEKEALITNDHSVWVLKGFKRDGVVFGFSPVGKFSPINLKKELELKRNSLANEFISLLDTCVRDLNSNCVFDGNENYISASQKIQIGLKEVEKSNFVVRSLFNLSFYNSMLVNKELHSEFNSQFSYLNSKYISDLIIPMYPQLVFDYSLSEYKGTDHIDELILSKKNILSKLKNTKQKNIFNFEFNLMEIEQ